MSAYLDRTQDIGFYFGNASEDLAHMLPPDEKHPKAADSIEGLSMKADQILETLSVLERKNAELAYLVSDVAKLLK